MMATREYQIDSANHMIEVEVEDELTGSTVFKPYCQEFNVIARNIDIITLDDVLMIELWADGLRKVFPLNRESLTRTKILPELLSKGLSVNDTPDDVLFVISVLLDMEDVAPIEHVYGGLGFLKNSQGTELGYFGHEPIVITDSSFSNAVYDGPLDAQPEGTFQDYKQILLDEVVGRPSMELALAIAVTAPLVYILRERGIVNDLPIFQLIGPSSTGKTTALRLIASVFGRPTEDPGLIGNFNGTENSLLDNFSRMLGFPLILDEATGSKLDFEKLFLYLSKGSGRKRLDRDGKQKEPVKFSGTLILSGEHPLIIDPFKETGASARAVELSLTWTDDAAHARRLQQKLMHSYGTAIVPIMTYFQKHRDRMGEAYNSKLELLMKEGIVFTAVEERIVKIFAIVLLAAEIVNKSLKVKIDCGNIRNVLIQQLISQRPPMDKTYSTYFFLLEYINTHGRMFVGTVKKYEGMGLPLLGNIYGVFDKYNDHPCVYIMKEQFEKMLTEAGVTNIRAMKRSLMERNFLVVDESRHYYVPHKIAEVQCDEYASRNELRPLCACLILPDEPVKNNRKKR